MAYPPCVVGSVTSFQEPAQGGPVGEAPAVEFLDVAKAEVAGAEVAKPTARLTLSNGSEYAIDPTDPRFPLWSRFLTGQVGSRKPLYIETDPSGTQATRVLPPRELRIAEILEDPNSSRLMVRAENSPMPRFLNPGHPQFENYLGQLNSAASSHQALSVTTDPDTAEILDLREVEGAGTGGAGPGAQAPPSLSKQKAEEEFQLLAGDAEIPFDYLRDCCASRAHEMYRLLSLANIGCLKIWNYGMPPGYLSVAVPGEPSEHLTWFFHVAPLVRLAHEGSPTYMVIDPSLFDRPATVGEWLALQNGVNAIHQVDSPEFFHRTIDAKSTERDDTFVKERDVLENHILLRNLQNLKRRTGP
jgi:hypothetical protein